MTDADPPAPPADLATGLRALEAGDARLALDHLLPLDPREPAARLAVALAWSLAENFHEAASCLAALDAEAVPPPLKPNLEAARATVRSGLERERSGQAARMADNLALLARDQPELASRTAGAALPEDWTWIVDRGELRFLLRQPAGLAEIHEPAGEAEVAGLHAPLLELCRTDRALLFGGLRYGKILEAAVRLHPDLPHGMRIPFYVLEPSPGLFALQLRFLPFADLLGKRNVRFFVGSDAVEQLGDHLSRNPFLHMPGGAVRLDDAGAVQRTLTERCRPAIEAEQAAAGAVRDAYASLDPRELADRFDRHPREPLRVLCITSRFSSFLRHSTAHAARAFESLGCRARVLEEDSDLSRLTFRALTHAMADFRPDLVFLIDHLRCELAPLPRSLPCITWIQDPMVHLFDPPLVRETGDLDFVYAVTPAFLPACREAGYREVGLLPMAADDRTYRPSGRVDPRLACDIAFPSHVVQPREPPQYPGLLARLIARYAEAPMRHTGEGSSLEMLRLAEADLGLRLSDEERRRLVPSVVVPAMRYTWRVPPIRWACEEGLRVRLFGSGWDSIPELRDLSHGPIEPGERLRDLYESARITLHLNEGLNVHQRVFEGLAAGGFVLVRELPSDREPGGLADQLEIGREILTFREREDFLRTVRRLLADDGDRRRIAEAGRARVLASHTYERRMEAVLGDIRTRLRRLAT